MHTLATVGLLTSYAVTILLAIAINRDPSRFVRPRRRASLAPGIIAGTYVAATNIFLGTRWLSSSPPFVIPPLTAGQLLIFATGIRPQRVVRAETATADNNTVGAKYSSPIQQPGRRAAP